MINSASHLSTSGLHQDESRLLISFLLLTCDGWLLIGLATMGLLSPWLSALLQNNDSGLAFFLDLLTHGQWLYLLALVRGVTLLFRHSPYAAVALALLPLPWLTVSPALPTQAPLREPGFRVAVANLHMAHPPLTTMEHWLDEEQPDLLVLLECTPGAARALNQRADLPHHFERPDESPFGICLRSAWPLVHPRAELDAAGIPWLHSQIDWAGRSIAVVAIHPMPPISAHFHSIRNEQLQALIDNLDPTQLAILAGDLNASPWSSAFAGLKQTGVRRASSLQPTWPAIGLGWIGTPIDQILVTTAWQGARRALNRSIGSDHRAISVLLW